MTKDIDDESDDLKDVIDSFIDEESDDFVKCVTDAIDTGTDIKQATESCHVRLDLSTVDWNKVFKSSEFFNFSRCIGDVDIKHGRKAIKNSVSGCLGVNAVNTYLSNLDLTDFADIVKFRDVFLDLYTPKTLIYRLSVYATNKNVILPSKWRNVFFSDDVKSIDDAKRFSDNEFIRNWTPERLYKLHLTGQKSYNYVRNKLVTLGVSVPRFKYYEESKYVKVASSRAKAIKDVVDPLKITSIEACKLVACNPTQKIVAVASDMYPSLDLKKTMETVVKIEKKGYSMNVFRQPKTKAALAIFLTNKFLSKEDISSLFDTLGMRMTPTALRSNLKVYKLARKPIEFTPELRSEYNRKAREFDKTYTSLISLHINDLSKYLIDLKGYFDPDSSVGKRVMRLLSKTEGVRSRIAEGEKMVISTSESYPTLDLKGTLEVLRELERNTSVSRAPKTKVALAIFLANKHLTQSDVVLLLRSLNIFVKDSTIHSNAYVYDKHRDTVKTGYEAHELEDKRRKFIEDYQSIIKDLVRYSEGGVGGLSYFQ